MLSYYNKIVQDDMKDIFDEGIFFEKLENLVTDPNISDYIYWTNMSSEEIADKVLSYKPIILPDLSNS